MKNEIKMGKTDSVLLIFTGGTISMSEHAETGRLTPLDFKTVEKYLPELKSMNLQITSIPFSPLVDSSDIHPEDWVVLAKIIQENYHLCNGFVVLHGTDTMAYSASALSFMLENLDKPVIFTGSQLPIGRMRSDAKENLITAIEIAVAKEKGEAIVPEVCIFFEDLLMRGNRTSKKNTELFNAFTSYNYPELGKVGVHINYFKNFISYTKAKSPLKIHTDLNQNIVILKLFPGIMEQTVNAILETQGLRGVVLESFGTGNAPRYVWLYNALKKATEKGIIILNISQCRIGSVEMNLYETSLNLVKAGVLSGYDLTVEAATAKLMFLLGQNLSLEEIKQQLNLPLRGEMTVQ